MIYTVQNQPIFFFLREGAQRAFLLKTRKLQEKKYSPEKRNQGATEDRKTREQEEEIN